MCDDYKDDILPQLSKPDSKINETEVIDLEYILNTLFFSLRNSYNTKNTIKITENLQDILNILVCNSIDIKEYNDIVEFSSFFLNLINDPISIDIYELAIQCIKGILCQPHPLNTMFLNFESISAFQNAFYNMFCHHAIDCINNIVVKSPDEFAEYIFTNNFLQNSLIIINNLDKDAKISFSRLISNASKLDNSNEVYSIALECILQLFQEQSCAKLCLYSLLSALNNDNFPIEKFIEKDFLFILEEYINSPMHDHCIISLQILNILLSRYNLDQIVALEAIVTYSLDDVMSEKKYWSLVVLSKIFLLDPIVMLCMNSNKVPFILLKQFDKMSSKIKSISAKIISLYFENTSEEEILDNLVNGSLLVVSIIDTLSSESYDNSNLCLSLLYKISKVCLENNLEDYLTIIFDFIEEPPDSLVDDVAFEQIIELFNEQ